MQIWPAIDLRAGQCVRLRQGDYDRQTVFSDQPLEIARRWVAAGARHLHLVDLDGAQQGQPVNGEVIRRIVTDVDAACQVGGGVRDEATIREWLALGVTRLVIGTQALTDPQWLRHMCRNYPGQLVLGVDARDGWVAGHGWSETSQVRAEQLVRQFEGEPLAAVVYTDIATDGMLEGPNVEAMAAMARVCACPLIASGGIRHLADVLQLASVPVAGVIIGRALYEGQLDLAEVILATGQLGDVESR